MPPIGNPSDKSVEQRRLAEERSRHKSITTAVPLSEADALRLVHELQVHQIELEMQNEELIESQAAIEEGLARYTDLYDFAPVGYFTLDRIGTITQLNLTGARYLGKERARLSGARFGLFVAQTDRLVFNAMFTQVFATQTSPSQANPSCEVLLEREGQPSLTVQIEATRSADGQTCRVVALDITERLRGEQVSRGQAATIQLNEQRLRAIFDAEPECVKLLAADGTLLEMNPAGLAMIEADSAEQVLGQCIYPVITPEHREEFQALVERVFRGESGFLEFEIIALKGTRRWMETHASPLHDSDGRVTAQLSITRDITEQKRAFQALRESERNLANAQRIAHMGSWSLDLTNLDDVNRNPLHWSDEVFRIFGYEPGQIEVSNDNFFRAVPLEDRPRIHEAMATALRERQCYSIDHRICLPDGTERIVHEESDITCDEQTGQPIRMSGTIQDITVRKQAEETLRESEQRLQLTTSNSNIGMWDWNLRTNQVHFSTIWKRQIGYEDHEITDRYEEWESRLHPDDRDRSLAIVNAYLANPVLNYESEFRFRHKDGSYRWILAKGSTQRDEQGRPCRLFGTHIDITERKQAEQTLKRTADRLSALLAIAQTLVDTLDLDTLLNQLLRHLTGVIAVNNRSAIFIYDPQAKVLVPRACIPADAETYRRIRLLPGESISGKVFQSGRSALLHNRQEIDALRGELQPENERLLAEDASGHFVRSTISVPLRTRSGEIIGTMTLGSAHGTFTEEDLSLLEGVAAQAAMAIQNASLFDEVHAGRERLQALSRQLIATQENERRHLARELHDEIGQALTGIKLNLKALQQPTQVTVRSSLAQETIAVVDQTLNQVRNLALDLRPSMLDDIGLVAALRWCLDRQAQRAGFGTHFHAEPSDLSTSSEIATACFRVAQESLTNIARHAQAKNVRVELRQRDSELELIVSDDGIGFDVSAARVRAIGGASIGLLGMAERVQLVGGQIEITSVPSKGTTIHARFPTTTQSARGRA